MSLTWPVAAIVLAGMICVTVLGALDKIDSMTLGAVFAFVIGGAIGHSNGYHAGIKQNGSQ